MILYVLLGLLLAAFLILSWLLWPFLDRLSSGGRALVLGGGFWSAFIAMMRGWLPRVRLRRR